MRVVMVSKACIVGQYQTKLEALARHRDLDLTVVVPPYWRDERGIVPLERVHTQGYNFLVQPIAFQGHFHLHYYPTLPRVFRDLRPDLVHIDEEPYNLATFHALRAARQVGARTLFFTWQNLRRQYPPPFSWIETYNLCHADSAIAGNAEAACILKEKGFQHPVCIVPQFGVQPEVFSPSQQLRRPGNSLQYGYAGRLVEEKGVQVLLEALADCPGEWTLRILGSGPYKATLENKSKTLAISQRVRFEPPVPSSRMPEFYRTLDVYVQPSLTRSNWKEQFGRVLIEAMACQVPVIGSSSGEIPNVVGDAGILFPEGDAAALRSQILALARDPDRRVELGTRGRARVLAHFTQDRVADQTYMVYRQMCSLPADSAQNSGTK